MNTVPSKAQNIIFLKSLDIFQSLDDRTLEKLLEDFKEISLEPGEILFQEGDPSDAMYVILDGELAIEKQSLLIARRKKGEYLGELGLIESAPRSATAKASKQSHLFQIHFEQFQTNFASNSKALMEVLKTVALRAREDLNTLDESLTQLDAEKKVSSQLQNFLDDTSNEIFTVDPETLLYTQMNSRALKNLGFDLNQIVQRKPFEILWDMDEAQFREWAGSLITGEKDHLEFDDYHQRRNGSIYPVRIRLKLDVSGNSPLIVGIAQDMSELKEIESKYMNLAFYDSLTGLPNKKKFIEQLQTEISNPPMEGNQVTLLVFEIQNFKNICNSLGHEFGDLVLKAVAKKLVDRSPFNAHFARCGENEFCGFTSHINPETRVAMVRHLMKSFKRPFSIIEQEIYINLAIGISAYPQNASEGETLFKQADTAKHFAKLEGTNSSEFYRPDMALEEKNRMFIERDLRKAVDNNEFELFYQPILDTRSNSFTGVEALIRWNHPQRGLLYPDDFNWGAEMNDLMIPMGDWVIKTACRQMKEWLEQKIPIKNMAINLSPQQFKNKNVTNEIKKIIEETGIPPKFLEMEITETILMDNLETAVPRLQEISSFGIEITLDDFGTGYSSLQYLKSFPLNNIKIDRMFVKDATCEEDATIAKAIVSLAKSFNLKTIAEGIETEKQETIMRGIGCDYLQGYLFGHPKNAADATELLLSKKV